ncbi:MAG: DNA-binding protein WhiA [Acholeplasmataceae bacterium]
MSFAKTVKKELITIPVELNEQLAEFAAFLHLNSELQIKSDGKSINFKTNNPAVARRFLQLIRTLYQSETSLIKQKRTALNQRYTIIIQIHTKIEDIISEHGFLEDSNAQLELLTRSAEAKKAYLRAAFLAVGSVNHPKTAEYHLELSTFNPEQIVFLQALMNDFDLNAKVTKRRKHFLVYLKDANNISDFIQLIGAQNAVFAFEDLRIKRDFNNSINRVINCEIANEKKIMMAADEQLKDIALIEDHRITIDDKTKEAIELRKENPEASLRELVEIFEETYNEKISRSGLNHRFNKIKQLAKLIRGES